MNEKEIAKLVKLKKRLMLVNTLLHTVNYEDEYLSLVKEKEEIANELNDLEKNGIEIKANVFNNSVAWSIYEGNKLIGYWGEKI